eukprot:218744_1
MNFGIGVAGNFVFSLFSVHRIFLPFLFGGEVVQEVSCFLPLIATARNVNAKYYHEQKFAISKLYDVRTDSLLDDEHNNDGFDDDDDDDDFYMPSYSQGADDFHGDVPSSSSSMNSSDDSGTSRRRTVFLIDDEQPILDAVGTYLSGEGYDVYPFLNATLPMQMLLHGHSNKNRQDMIPRMPDAIICDIMMPLISGIDFLTMIRSNPTTLNMPFILLTAKSLVGDRVRGYDAGTDGYLMKPFDPEELLVMMDSIIKRKEFMEFYQDSVTVEDLREDLDEVREALKKEERFLLGGASSSSSATSYSKLNGDESSETFSFQSDDRFASSNRPLLSLDEMDVLELLCDGYMNKEIASELQYSVRWVEGHLTSMFRKANCRNRTELVRWAVANEFVDMGTY